MGILGADVSLNTANLGNVGQSLMIVLSLIIFLVIAGFISFLIYTKRQKKKEFVNKIHIYKDYKGQRLKIGEDFAKEVFIPNSNISVFYLFNRKLYLPRPTRPISKNEYLYCIFPNGEWVNFDLGKFESDSPTLKPGYDHRDTRYAYLNLKEVIDRNFRKKSVKWWKEHGALITFIVMAFIFVLGCVIIVIQLKGAIQNLNNSFNMWKEISSNLKYATEVLRDINSGVVKVG